MIWCLVCFFFNSIICYLIVALLKVPHLILSENLQVVLEVISIEKQVILPFSAPLPLPPNQHRSKFCIAHHFTS